MEAVLRTESKIDGCLHQRWSYPYEIEDKRRNEHVVELHVVVLQDVFEATARTVLGDDADIWGLRARTDEGVQIVVPDVTQLRHGAHENFGWERQIYGTHHLQLHLHLTRDIDRLLSDLLDGIKLALVQTDWRENCRVSEVCIGVGAQAHLTRSYERVGGPCLLLRAIRLVLVHLDLLEVDFPQQTVELLLISPVAVQHERDDGEDEEDEAGNGGSDFSCVAYTLLASKTARWLRNWRPSTHP
jgi:hypothetical protein